MLYSSDNAKISIKGNDIFKGKQKTNGVPLQGEFIYSLRTGGSVITITDSLKASLGVNNTPIIPFGHGLWNEVTNPMRDSGKIFCGLPVEVGRTFAFVGILMHDAGLQTGTPMFENEELGFGIQEHNMYTILKQGYAWYKRLWDASKTELDFTTLTHDMQIFVLNEDGRPVAAVPTGFTDGVPTLADCTYVGKIVVFDGDTKSVVINIL